MVKDDIRDVGLAEPEVAPERGGYTSQLLRRAFTFANRVSQANATAPTIAAHPRDFVILGVLSRRETFSQQHLADGLGIDRTTMVKLIDKLEDSDYVTRKRNPEDRRSYIVSVTTAGRRALAEMEPVILAGEARFTSALSPREHQELDELLRQLLPRVPLATALRTGSLIAQTNLVLRRRDDEALASVDLQARHFAALAALMELEPCSQQQLALHLGATEPAAVLIVDDLEKADLVARRRARDDRRRYALELTPKGRAKLEAARSSLDAAEIELSESLGEGVDERLHELLAKLLSADA